MTAPTVGMIKTRLEALLALYDGMGSIITKDMPELLDLPAAHVRGLDATITKVTAKRVLITRTYGIYLYVDELTRNDVEWDAIDALEAAEAVSTPLALHLLQYDLLRLPGTDSAYVQAVGDMTISEVGAAIYNGKRYMAFWMYLPITIYAST